MKQVLSILALAAAGLAGPALAQTYQVVASGPAESPPNASPGNGVVTLDLNASTLMVDLPFRELVGNTTAAHIHCCTLDPFSGTAGIAIPFDDFPTGVRSGTFSATLPLYETSTYDPAFLAAHGGSARGAASALLDGMNANEAYLNIHTSAYPNGEIRGFAVAAPVPEPSEWGMLAGGLGALWWVSRRRRREAGWQR